MFTVIIMTNEAAASSQEYRRLFFNELSANDDAGFCIWHPDGTTVETALPDLYKLIAGKREWRAIILQTEQDRDEEQHPTQQNNPFDFRENANSDTFRVAECRIPLVHLAQMLGGVPEPDVEYEYREFADEGSVWQDDPEGERAALTRQVRRYEPKKDDFRAAMHDYERLIRSPRFRFVETRPVEILMISTRRSVDNTAAEIETAWHLERETNSSEFWHRNFYPAGCRFLVFNTLDEAHSLYPASLFRLWTVVLLLAGNKISPSSLQAYRLYRVDVTLDMRRLGDEFSRFYERLMDMTEQMDLEEQNYVPVSEEVAKKAPQIRRKIEVVFPLQNEGSMLVDTSSIGLTCDNPEEHSFWRSAFETATYGLRRLYRSPERVLDIAADDARAQSVFDHRDISALNRYQRDDLERDLEETYMEALDARGSLGLNPNKRTEEREIINSQVHNRIGERLTRAKLRVGLALGLGCMGVGLLPYVIYAGMKSLGNFLWALIVSAGCLGVALVFAGVELLIQRREMQDAMEDHNRLMNEVLSEFRHSGEQFGAYLSAVSTYQRGRSYLDQEEKLRSGRFDSNVQRRIHRKAIRRYGAALERWAEALGASLETGYSTGARYSFDISVSPKENVAYSMNGAGMHRAVALNGTGDLLESPCDFVTGLSIQREELFDRPADQQSTENAWENEDFYGEEDVIDDADLD